MHVADRSGLRAKDKAKTEGAGAEAFAGLVGEAVRRARQSRGWTQLELAEASELSSNYLARLERGEVSPSLFVAQRLCTALDVDLDCLTSPERGAARTTKRRVR